MSEQAIATTGGAMEPRPVDLATAVRIEAAEGRAWVDCYAAAPPGFAAEAGVGSREVGGAAVLAWAASGRRYFSRAMLSRSFSCSVGAVSSVDETLNMTPSACAKRGINIVRANTRISLAELNFRLLLLQ